MRDKERDRASGAVPNMGAGSSYTQTVRDALEGKQGGAEKGKGKERGEEATGVQRKEREESREAVAERVATWKAQREEEERWRK